MAAAKKPTAQQKAQAKARAGGNDAIKVTKAGVKRLGKAALIAGSLTPVGRGVKVASMAVKAASKIAPEARALKAAQGKSLASPVKKAVAKKNAKERLVTQNLAKANIKAFKQNPKSAYANAAKIADDIKARDIKFAKKSPNTYDKKTMKNVKFKNIKSK